MQDLLRGISIFLIGMMGTGKTTLGEVLARQLGYRFYDTDVLLERVSGKTIGEIFASEGEEVFRELETQVLKELSAYTKSVIATGGGIVMRPQNWSYLHHGLVVWLDAPVALLVKRLAEDDTRPLLVQGDLTGKLTALLEKRQSFYSQADLRLSIEGDHTPDELVSQLISQIPSAIKPKPISPSHH